MLERIFEQQDCLKIVSHPFSSSRGIQLSWMQSETFAGGMATDELSKYNVEIENSISGWRKELSHGEDEVYDDNTLCISKDR